MPDNIYCFRYKQYMIHQLDRNTFETVNGTIARSFQTEIVFESVIGANVTLFFGCI